MFHRPEKVLEVRVHDPLPAALDLLPNFAHGILRRSPSPVSKAGCIKYRLEDGFQSLQQRLPTDAIRSGFEDGSWVCRACDTHRAGPSSQARAAAPVGADSCPPSALA